MKGENSNMNVIERLDIMNAEQITEEQVWNASEIKEVPHILEPEVRTDVPGMEKAIVYGDPVHLGDILDYQQGFDNPYGSFGTCGETSISNICKIAGMDVTEPEVLQYAMENNLCQKDDPKFRGGATTIGNQIALLEHYGLPSHCEFAAETATPERLAEVIEGGHGVLLGLNSGVLQDREWKAYNEAGEITATHAICLTGTVYTLDGKLAGFYLCDSSGQNPDSGRTFVPLDKFDACYSNVKDAFAVITDKPIR